MASTFDGYVIELTLTQIKRCEKIFIINDVPYFTDGSLLYNMADYSSIMIINDINIINASGLIRHIEDNNLNQEIKDELNIDIDWIENNKVIKSTLF